MMKILYDGQIYGMQTAGGINRYFANVISRLPQTYVPILTAIRHSSLNYPSHPNLKVYKYKRFRFNQISSTIEKYYFRALNNLIKYNIAHPTYYSLLTQQEIKEYTCPVVITVYDMINEIFANQFDLKSDIIEAKRQAIIASQAILCISENTKKDLLRIYPFISEEKVTVTYLASELDSSLSYGHEQVPSKPYYLYVGSRQNEYKNFHGLLMAFAKVVSVNSEVSLCVVGLPFNDTETKLINNLKLSNYIECYRYADDSHLAKLYRCSLAFIYPSLYEGFGIPPLEAMACGTVVVASNSSSIPEVVGDGGILFDPQKISDLADILLSLIDNFAERDRLIAKGYERSKLFNWDQTVAKTLEVYNSVI